MQAHPEHLRAGLYRDILEDLGLSDKPVTPAHELLTVSALCNERGWLPRLMIKSDEISMLILGARLWNVAYVADHQSCVGISYTEMTSELRDRAPQSYRDIPLLEDPPHSLRVLIARHAVVSTIELQNGIAVIEPLRGYYNVSGPLEHGEIFPLPVLEALQCHELNKLITSISQKRVIEYCLGRAGRSHDAMRP